MMGVYSRFCLAFLFAVCLLGACGCGKSFSYGQGGARDGIWEEIGTESAGGSGALSAGEEPALAPAQEGSSAANETAISESDADPSAEAGQTGGDAVPQGKAEQSPNDTDFTGTSGGRPDGPEPGETDTGAAGSRGKEIKEVTLPDGTKQSDDASGFVFLSEAVPDALQEIRYYSTYNFVGDRIDGYEEPSALLTKEAASALKAVSDDVMAQGYRLKIYDAYRPQQAVDHFVRWAQDPYDMCMKQDFYPELDKSVLFRKGYIARRSGHSRGSTVDLTLVDNSTGLDVDMGGTFDHFGDLSHPDYAGITPEQSANRNLLRNAMTARGFKPISTEWWHFTLANEPYPGTYFTFPVSSASVPR